MNAYVINKYNRCVYMYYIIHIYILYSIIYIVNIVKDKNPNEYKI